MVPFLVFLPPHPPTLSLFDLNVSLLCCQILVVVVGFSVLFELCDKSPSSSPPLSLFRFGFAAQTTQDAMITTALESDASSGEQANATPPLLLPLPCPSLLPHESAQRYHTFTLGLGAPTLLSGSLGACIPNSSAATCVGGIASLAAYARHMLKKNATDAVVLMPELDAATPFVQMHPGRCKALPTKREARGSAGDIFGDDHHHHHAGMNSNMSVNNANSSSSNMSSNPIIEEEGATDEQQCACDDAAALAAVADRTLRIAITRALQSG